MLPWRHNAALSPMGHSHVNVEAKGPYKLQQGLTHRHSHLEVSTGMAGERVATFIPNMCLKDRIPLRQGSPLSGDASVSQGALYRLPLRPQAGEDVF